MSSSSRRLPSPDASPTSRSAAAASAEPPAMPPATGIRLSISRRTGGPCQFVHSRNARSAVAARFSPSMPGQMTSSAAIPSGSVSMRTSSQSVRESISVTIS